MAQMSQIIPTSAPIQRLAAHLAAAALLCLASCTETDRGGNDGIITVEGASQTIILAAEPRAAYVFSIRCDSDWKVSLSDSWMAATPTSCRTDGSANPKELYFTAFPNEREFERKGTLTLESDSDKVTFPVIQLPSGFSKGIRAVFRESTGELPTTGGQLRMTVFSDRDWSMSPPEWTSADITSGKAYTTTSIIISVGENLTGCDRSGEIIFLTDVGRLTVPVSQVYEIQKNIIAGWTLGDNDFMTDWNVTNGYCWTSAGYLPADTPEGCRAVASWNNGDNSSATRTYIISSDLAGHLAVKPTWVNDNMKFDIPLEGVSKGDSLRFRAAIQSNVISVPADWVLEHSEADVWITDLPLKLPALKTPVGIEAGWRVTQDMVEQGRILIRVRCDGNVSVGGTVLESPQSGSALRFVPYPDTDEESGYISVSRIR
ncbi:MAG: BACON domain-containing protein [Candidatus Cryptobacteroides sp.]